jgi:hypothetical protein
MSVNTKPTSIIAKRFGGTLREQCHYFLNCNNPRGFLEEHHNRADAVLIADLIKPYLNFVHVQTKAIRDLSWDIKHKISFKIPHAVILNFLARVFCYDDWMDLYGKNKLDNTTKNEEILNRRQRMYSEMVSRGWDEDFAIKAAPFKKQLHIDTVNLLIGSTIEEIKHNRLNKKQSVDPVYYQNGAYGDLVTFLGFDEWERVRDGLPVRYAPLRQTLGGYLASIHIKRQTSMKSIILDLKRLMSYTYDGYTEDRILWLIAVTLGYESPIEMFDAFIVQADGKSFVANIHCA